MGQKRYSDQFAKKAITLSEPILISVLVWSDIYLMVAKYSCVTDISNAVIGNLNDQ
jgi:hypothetical protein